MLVCGTASLLRSSNVLLGLVQNHISRLNKAATPLLKYFAQRVDLAQVSFCISGQPCTYAYLLTDLLLNENSDELLRDIPPIRAGKEVRKCQLGEHLLQLRITPFTVRIHERRVWFPGAAHLAMISASL